MALIGTLTNIGMALPKQAFMCNRWSLVFQYYRQNQCRFKSNITHLTSSNVNKISQRHRATVAIENAIPHPTPMGENKKYSDKITTIVDDIAKLTLIEVADLNELLKKTLNIQDAPMMAMGASMAPQPAQEEEESETTSKKVQTMFVVKLEKFDDTKKVALIKEIKNNVEGMNLVQAKKFVESAPQVVKADIPKDEADKLKAALEAVGGTCTIV